MEVDGDPGATGDPVGDGAKGGLGLRASADDLDAGRAMEDQDPIKGRRWLEATDQRRDRWAMARTLLFGMQVIDLEWVVGAGFLENMDPGVAICGGEVLVGLSMTERRILQEMAQVMLEIMVTGGSLRESENRDLQARLESLSVMQLLGCTGGTLSRVLQ